MVVVSSPAPPVARPLGKVILESCPLVTTYGVLGPVARGLGPVVLALAGAPVDAEVEVPFETTLPVAVRRPKCGGAEEEDGTAFCDDAAVALAVDCPLC